MPAEQRVITFGFSIAGLVVVGILYWFFGRADPVVETLDEIRGDLYPRYQSAEEDRDYAAWRRSAQAILEALDDGGRQVSEKSLQVDATGDDKNAQRLYRLVKSKVIDRVAKGEFPYGDEFYPETVHGALMDLEDLVGGEFKTLERARRLAKDMSEALDRIRAGSGDPVPLPAAYDLGDDNNPLLVHDAKIFAVFRVDPKLVTGALQTKNPGGRANSFRINWNKDSPGATLARQLTETKPALAELRQVAARFQAGYDQIRNHPDGPAAAKKIYGDACDKLAEGLPSAARKKFDAHRALYENGDAIVKMLRDESNILGEGEGSWEALGAAIQLRFP